MKAPEEFVKSAEEMSEELNSGILNASKIHGPLYGRLLRESYNALAWWYVVLAQTPPEQGEKMDFLGQIYSKIQADMQLLTLSQIEGDAPGSLTPSNRIRTAFATDLQALLGKIMLRNKFVILTGDRGEANGSSSSSQDSGEIKPLDPSIWPSQSRQDPASGDGG